MEILVIDVKSKLKNFPEKKEYSFQARIISLRYILYHVHI